MNAISKLKNNEKKATVERSVQMSRMKVKMNQPYECCISELKMNYIGSGLFYHQIKSKFIGKSTLAYSIELIFNLETTWGENDGE